MGKRQPRPEPFSIQELEEIAQSPALQGFDAFLRYRTAVAPTPASTVDTGPRSPVDVVSPSTVDVDTASTVEVGNFPSEIWVAEGTGALFPPSRVRPIQKAQDALTHIEESVYDALWGRKDRTAEKYRSVRKGYDVLAKEARIAKRNIVNVIQRLTDKGFIQVEAPPDYLHRVPTSYRVLGYAAVLEDQRKLSRHFVVRTGNGIFYVHKKSLPQPAPSRRPQSASTVDTWSTSTVDAGIPSTGDAGIPPTADAGVPSTVDAASTANTLDKKSLGTTSSVRLLQPVLQKFGIEMDDDGAGQLIQSCRQTNPTVTDEEIAHFTALTIEINRNAGVRKWAGFLRVSVPKFLTQGSTRLEQYRAGKERERADTIRTASLTLNDPDAPEQLKRWARAVLEGAA